MNTTMKKIVYNELIEKVGYNCIVGSESELIRVYPFEGDYMISSVDMQHIIQLVIKYDLRMYITSHVDQPNVCIK